ncbi:STAS domain protein [Leptospira perolatii]|uniref:STAS domain protein n=1 Tax=Leptospira perolatii TaxID=2023191 RepID=A0A2M9ZPG0_9LEPT|nr:STAS domain protein [Leptospira perolatii]PJZ70774.1 STAS domain protein [Leptospira perolatii]PJZ73982.1 STAS domain protein [Leptospira perolatii]
MEQVRRFSFFEIRKKDKVTEIEPLSRRIDNEQMDELQSILAMVFYESNRHIKIEFNSVESISLVVLVRLLKFGLDLREKKRVLIFAKPKISVQTYLERFHLSELVLVV